jgi:hypothetical protein
MQASKVILTTTVLSLKAKPGLGGRGNEPGSKWEGWNGFLFFKTQYKHILLIHVQELKCYKHTPVHTTRISISDRLNRLDIEIHEVGHQERLTVDEDIASHRKNN